MIILEPKLEYWIEFVEPLLDKIQQHRKQAVLECHRQKYDEEEEWEDGHTRLDTGEYSRCQ